MKLPIVVKWDWLLNLASWINGFRVAGIEFIPCLVVVRDPSDKVLVNHETIHYYQMLETLFVGFYAIYVGHYLVNRLRGLDHMDAYLTICFEREAYRHQRDLHYLENRKRFAWLRNG